MNPIINPLNVFVVWHPSFKNGYEYANSFFSYYNHDINSPLSRGIGIPVYFRTGDNPVYIDITNAEYNAIIIFVDDEMVISKCWGSYIEEIINLVERSNCKNMIFPIAFSPNAFKLTNKLPSKNFIRFYNENVKNLDYLLSRTTHELCRLLYDIDRINHEGTGLQISPPPLKLFISHAKEDGVNIAKKLSDYIQSQSPVKTFFDANDITTGYDFTHEIEENITKSVLLVIHSDKYSSREWCRREVLIAKRNNRPIVVINLYKNGEDRSFPYMANLKTIRFNEELPESEMFEKIILLALIETLRFKYQQMFINYLTKKFDINGVEILSHPPELLSLLHLHSKDNKLIIYPDPPLSEEELNIVKLAKEDMQYITPTYIPLISKVGKYNTDEHSFLDGLNVGISISESQNIKKYGFEHIHLQDVLVEFTRYLLASGASLSYGGDVRYDTKFNFAQILFDLARTYQKENVKPPDNITNFVSYPIYTQMSTELKAKLSDVAKFVEVPPPDKLEGNHSKIAKAETPEDLHVWARSLTEMRKVMNSKIDARIVLGGKLTGYKGKIPGIVEEVYLALVNEKPIYLIGAMGGAAKIVIDCLLGKTPEELTEDYQFENNNYKELYTIYNQQALETGIEPISYKKLVSFFNEKGIVGLKNGLSDEENIKLFNTINITEMISLVMKGLMSIKHD